MNLRLQINDSIKGISGIEDVCGKSTCNVRLRDGARRTPHLRQYRAVTAGVAAILALAAPGCAGGMPIEESVLVTPPSFEPGAQSPVVDGALTGSRDQNAAAAAGTDQGADSQQATLEIGLAKSAPVAAVNAVVPAYASGTTSVATLAAPTAQLVQHATMTTSGRQLLDSCGNEFVVRGVEQIFGEQLPEGNDWVGLLEQIAASGVNAVRVLAGTDTLALSDVDAMLALAGSRGLVAYVTPYGDEGRSWLEGSDVRAMLAKHEKYIIIDAFGEPTFDDRGRFLAEATEAIQQVRSWGYRVPLTVTANQFGRDLPSLLELGAQIVDSDPLGNTVLGWQAYWGSGGYYQETYGMSLTEAVQAVANAPFPIQLGLDRITDFPSSQTADFGTLLSATEANGIGWLWWDWYNPYGNENNLTEDGSATQLTPTGQAVVSEHAASIQKTSKLICAAAD